MRITAVWVITILAVLIVVSILFCDASFLMDVVIAFDVGVVLIGGIRDVINVITAAFAACVDIIFCEGIVIITFEFMVGL